MMRPIGSNWVYDDTNDRIGDAIGRIAAGFMTAGLQREHDGDYRGNYVGLTGGNSDKENYYKGLSSNVNDVQGVGTPNSISVDNAMSAVEDNAFQNNEFLRYARLNGDGLENAQARIVNDQYQGTKNDYNNFTSPFLAKLKANTTGVVKTADPYDGSELKKKILKNSNLTPNGAGYNNFGFTSSNPFRLG